MSNVAQAQEVLETLHEVSNLLNTGLDRETLSILLSLCELGVNPEALVAVVNELRREANSVQSKSLVPNPPAESSTKLTTTLPL